MALSAQTKAQFDEQREIRREHKQTYQLMGGFSVLIIGVWIGAQLFGNDAGFTTNLYTEALSIGVTVLVLNWFAERRTRNERKKTLFLQLGSQSNDFALEAKRQLALEKGWLEEALAQKKFPLAGWQGIVHDETDLSKIDLQKANLTGASLSDTSLNKANLISANLSDARLFKTSLASALLIGANLHKVSLVWCDLSDATLVAAKLTKSTILESTLKAASLSHATIENATLQQTDLKDADLEFSNITNVNITFSNLTNASLKHARLENVDFQACDLTNVNLDGTRFLGDIVLPDWSRWTPDTDMARFTDPDHPQFWRSNHPLSPAWRGSKA